MKKNKTYLLAVIFILLVVVAYFLNRERKETTYKLDEKILTVDSAAVDKLEIEYRGKKITLAKSGIEWKITEPINYNAYQQFIASALSDLKKYKVVSKVSDNPDNKDRFGFNDTNVTKVTIYQSGNLLGSILVGNSANGPGQSYIKKADGKEIFLADDFLRSNFFKSDLNEWRDKLIVAITKGAIKTVEFISSGENYKVDRDTSANYVCGKDSVKSTDFDGVLNIISNLNTQTFKDSTLGENVKFDYTIKVTADKLYEINFLKSSGETPNMKYFLKVSGVNQLFEVDENFLKSLFKTKKDLIVPKK